MLMRSPPPPPALLPYQVTLEKVRLFLELMILIVPWEALDNVCLYVKTLFFPLLKERYIIFIRFIKGFDLWLGTTGIEKLDRDPSTGMDQHTRPTGKSIPKPIFVCSASKKGFYNFKWLGRKIMRRKVLHDVWKLYEVQILAFHWNTSTLICLYIVSSCFGAKKAEISSCDRARVGRKA